MEVQCPTIKNVEQSDDTYDHGCDEERIVEYELPATIQYGDGDKSEWRDDINQVHVVEYIT